MRYRNEVHIYEEVEHVLSVLKEAGYELIISSNAAREFIDFQIAPIKGFFSHIFSATSDFGEVKKFSIPVYAAFWRCDRRMWFMSETTGYLIS